jgi:hypothetical protein
MPLLDLLLDALDRLEVFHRLDMQFCPRRDWHKMKWSRDLQGRRTRGGIFVNDDESPGVHLEGRKCPLWPIRKQTTKKR